MSKKTFVTVGALASIAIVVTAQPTEASENGEVLGESMPEQVVSPEGTKQVVAAVSSIASEDEPVIDSVVPTTKDGNTGESVILEATANENLVAIEGSIQPVEDETTSISNGQDTLVLTKAVVADEFIQPTIEKTVLAATDPTIATQFPDAEMQKSVIKMLGELGFANLTSTSIITEEMIEKVDNIHIFGDDYATIVTSIEGISIFKNATSLHLERIAIPELTTEITQLLKVKNLTISQNRSLTDLPDFVWSLPLQSFTLDTSPIGKLPDIPDGSEILSTLNTMKLASLNITDLDFMLYKKFIQLNKLDLQTLKLAHLPDAEAFPILTDSSNLTVTVSGSQHSWIPKLYEEFSKNGTSNIKVTMIGGMLHPDTTKLFGEVAEFTYQLALKDPASSITINNSTMDISEELYDLVKLSGLTLSEYYTPKWVYDLSPEHNLQLVDLVDENENPVQLSDYYVNGAVIKSGTVKARIRSMPGENALGELSPFHVTDYISVDFVVEPQPVTVKYVDENGNEIQSADVYTGEVDEAFSFSPPKISNYIYSETEGEAEGVFSGVPQTITFIYKLEEEIIPPVVTPPVVDPPEVDPPEVDVEDEDGEEVVEKPFVNGGSNGSPSLPQTNNASTSSSLIAGILMLLSSTFLLWRRKGQQNPGENACKDTNH